MLGLATATDILDVASKAGTFPMQVLMLAAIITLGLVIARLHKQNQKTMAEWTERMEAKEAAMAEERRDRIRALMEMVKDDIAVKRDLHNAISNNTHAIDRLERLMQKALEMIESLRG